MPYGIGLLFAIMLVLLVSMARRQQAVRPGRRLAVCFGLAVLATLPAIWAMSAPVVLVRTWFEPGMVADPNGTLQIGAGPGVDLLIVIMACALILKFAMFYVRVPARHRRLEELPEVDDAAIRARLDAFAALHGREPVTLRMDRVGLGVMAFAFDGLVPFLVVGDGAFNRLDPNERDAILGHELGHVLRRHAVRMMFAIAVPCVAAAGLSVWMPSIVAALWLLGGIAWCRIVVSYGEELAADRLAAEYAGAENTIRALDKMHAALRQRDASPWWYAFVTHPHLAVRAAALARRAGLEPGDYVPYDRDFVRRCILARRVGVALGGAMLGGSLALAMNGWFWSAGALGLLLAFSPALLVLGLQPWRRILDGLAMTGWRSVVPLLVRLGLFVGGFGCVIGVFWVTHAAQWPLLAGGLALMILSGFVGKKETRARLALNALLQQRDYAGWSKRFRELPPRLQQRADLWVVHCEVLHALGDEGAADDGLERLLARWPRYQPARVVRMSRWRARDPQRGVAIAREFVADAPNHPAALASLASLLGHAGELEEAWRHCQTALALRPAEGDYHAIASRLATLRGDLDAASAALERAAALEPGAECVLIARAELELARGSDAAPAAVERAATMVDGALFSIYGPDIAALRERVESSG